MCGAFVLTIARITDESKKKAGNEGSPHGCCTARMHMVSICGNERIRAFYTSVFSVIGSAAGDCCCIRATCSNVLKNLHIFVYGRKMTNARNEWLTNRNEIGVYELRNACGNV